MKPPSFRTFLPLATALLLAACAASNAVTYTMDMDVTDAEQRAQLGDQALRVIERRLERMGEIPSKKDVAVNASGATVSVTVETQEAIDQLTEELQRPFEFKVMAQADEGQEPELTVDGHGGFVSTAVDGEDLQWVEGRKEPGRATGEVKLVFTEQGRTEMADIFATRQGKIIGIFVRGQLVSKLLVDTNELKDDIVIREIPSPELAQIFAEDVNVGLHVTFTPVP